MLTQQLWAGQAEQLFCEGLYQEIGLGDLEAAIDAYEKVVAGHTDNVATAAKAQLRIGLCNEKLKRTKEALAAYNKLIADYPDQPETEQAQERLDALGAKKEDEKISQAVCLENRLTNNEINKYNVQIKILNVIRHVKLGKDELLHDSNVLVDMRFLMERGVSERINNCSLKLFVNEEKKVDTQSWLPLENAQVVGRNTSLLVGLENYFKKDYGVQINLADIRHTAWIRFPEKELPTGHSWSNSLVRFFPERLITTYTLSGIERRKDTDCAVIASSSEQKGFAVPIGDSRETNYQLTENGTIYWAHQLGALVECKTDVAIEATILQQIGDTKIPTIHSELKISLLIERIGPDRRYSSPENTLRELIDALNKKDKERYYACFAKDHQQLSQEFPEAQDFLDNYFSMPGELMIG